MMSCFRTMPWSVIFELKTHKSKLPNKWPSKFSTQVDEQTFLEIVRSLLQIIQMVKVDLGLGILNSYEKTGKAMTFIEVVN